MRELRTFTIPHVRSDAAGYLAIPPVRRLKIPLTTSDPNQIQRQSCGTPAARGASALQLDELAGEACRLGRSVLTAGRARARLAQQRPATVAARRGFEAERVGDGRGKARHAAGARAVGPFSVDGTSGILETKAGVRTSRTEGGPVGVGLEGGLGWSGHRERCGAAAPAGAMLVVGDSVGEGALMQLRMVADLCDAVADLIALSPKVAAQTARKLGRVLLGHAAREERAASERAKRDERRQDAYERKQLAAASKR